MPKKLTSFKPHVYLFIFMCLCAGVLFAFVLEQNWHTPRIEQIAPPFPVPGAAFYIICILTYLCQGVAFAIVSEHPRRTFYELGVSLFWGQFILGIFWLGIFFGMESIGLALFDIFAAFFMILFSFGAFKNIDLRAALLLVPQGFLTMFLAFINISILLLQI